MAVVDDYFATTSTTGTVTVGGTKAGNIEILGDVDWFKVALQAGISYQIDLEGASTVQGTLGDPFLEGIYNASGTLLANTTVDDGGTGLNSRLLFTAPTTGNYFIGAGGYLDFGTYLVAVTQQTSSTGKVFVTATSASKNEGNSGTTAYTFTVTRDTSSGSASVQWAVTGSGAHPASAGDFSGGVLPSGTVNFANGETSKVITVNVSGDTAAEYDELFTVTLSNPVNLTLGTGSVSTTLTDSASGGDEVLERSYLLASGTGDFVLNYDMRSMPDQAEIFVNGVLRATTGGFVSNTGTLTVADNLLNAGDTVMVRMTGGDPGTVWDVTVNYAGGAQTINYVANGNILNDDGTPAAGGIWITATDAVKLEGNSGPTAFTFTVMRDGDTSGTASVDWTVTGSGANPANATDFFGGAFPSGIVSFSAGETSKVITVNVNGDTTFEPDELFTVTLSNAVNGTIGASGGTGGGAAGTATTFTPIAGTDASAALAMAQKMLGTASGITLISAQYTGVAGAASMFDNVNLGSAGGSTLTLGAGVLLTSGDGTPPVSNTESSYDINHSAAGDTALDGYASTAFTGAGQTRDASILRATFTVAGQPTHVSIDLMFGSEEFPEYSNSSYVDIAAIEIDGVNYAYFNNNQSQPLSVINNNLTAGNFIDNQGNILAIEYDGISAPLRVVGALNQQLTQHTIRIAIADTGDHYYDSGIFVSNLRTSTGNGGGGGISIISQDSADGTILNDDNKQFWIEADAAVKAEGHSGITPLTFTVSRTGSTSSTASVQWAVTGSGANPANASDFYKGILPSGTVTFAAGESEKTITVNVNGDLSLEHNETFTVTLSNPVGGVLGTGSVSTTLSDSASGGDEVLERSYLLAGGNGDFVLDYDMMSMPDQAEIFVNGVLRATTGGFVSYTGTLTVADNLLNAGDTVLVRMTGGDPGTLWDFDVTYTGGAQSVGYLAGGTIINDELVAQVFDDGQLDGNDNFALYKLSNGQCVIDTCGLTVGDSPDDPLALLVGTKNYAPKIAPSALLEYNDGSFGVVAGALTKWSEQMFDNNGQAVGKALKLTLAQVLHKEVVFGEDINGDGIIGDTVAQFFDVGTDNNPDDNFGLYLSTIAGAYMIGAAGLDPGELLGNATMLMVGTKAYKPKLPSTSLLEYNDGSFGVMVGTGTKWTEQKFDNNGLAVGKAVKLTMADVWGKETSFIEDINNDGMIGDPSVTLLGVLAPQGDLLV